MLFFFNDTATTEIYPLSLHDALPIFAFGTPMVLVPVGAAAGAHQLANARAVAEAGAAAVIQESELDGDRVTSIVTGLLDDRDRLRRMAAAARKAGRPDAARQVAAELRALGGCG